jgi:hypothetical protein
MFRDATSGEYGGRCIEGKSLFFFFLCQINLRVCCGVENDIRLFVIQDGVHGVLVEHIGVLAG